MRRVGVDLDSRLPLAPDTETGGYGFLVAAGGSERAVLRMLPGGGGVGDYMGGIRPTGNNIQIKSRHRAG